eukprot:gene11006-11160_t
MQDIRKFFQPAKSGGLKAAVKKDAAKQEEADPAKPAALAVRPKSKQQPARTPAAPPAPAAAAPSPAKASTPSRGRGRQPSSQPSSAAKASRSGSARKRKKQDADSDSEVVGSAAYCTGSAAVPPALCWQLFA